MAGVYSVSQVNGYIRNMFEQDFVLNRISVRGEVSNCKYHSTGHLYFTMKDHGGAIACVMFASSRKRTDPKLEEGMQVICDGSIRIYERDGKYQLYVSRITREGTGELFRIFEERKRELEEMGMFSPDYKKPIPPYGMKIGVVTAETGAAIHDIINVASRRNPYVQLILSPAQVQGEGAAESIAAAIRRLDAAGTDCMIVGRGGGSIEDLWAFNEEVVARAIFYCDTPVISAVGHETDFTIADFVADLRAPTPSAAAELAVFDYARLEETLLGHTDHLDMLMARKLELVKGRLEQNTLRLKRMHPGARLDRNRRQAEHLKEQLKGFMDRILTDRKHRLELAAGMLEARSPLSRLTGGFAYVAGADGRPVGSVGELNVGAPVSLRFRDGRAEAEITGVTPENVPSTESCVPQPEGQAEKRRNDN